MTAQGYVINIWKGDSVHTIESTGQHPESQKSTDNWNEFYAKQLNEHLSDCFHSYNQSF